MPRQARIDIMGLLYHVMSRGIERRRIFLEDGDYMAFQARVSEWLKKTGAKCLAWCLMPNHFHLLVLRGQRPLSEMMHHTMTGYAINFNIKHRRVGHLFQNRYKAIICDLDAYLSELVPYIHLNPLRAGIIKNLTDLGNYKWCGHAAVVRSVEDGILDRGALLQYLGDTENGATEKYSQLLAERANNKRQNDVSGGGLLRSFGGMSSALKACRTTNKVFFDQRILGGSDFTENVLKAVDEPTGIETKSRVEVLAEAENITGVSRDDIFRHTRERKVFKARAIYCYLCSKEAGISGSELMQELRISSGGISKLVAKGQAFIREKS